MTPRAKPRASSLTKGVPKTQCGLKVELVAFARSKHSVTGGMQACAKCPVLRDVTAERECCFWMNSGVPPHPS